MLSREMALRLRGKLARGAPVFGPFMKTLDPAFVEVAGFSGFDYAILDMEHGPVGTENLANLIRAAQVASIAPVVRVPGISEEAIGKALDLGACGVQVPQVASAGEAAEAVRLAKFHPAGERGVCRYVRSAGYSSIPRARYFAESNDALVILQLEIALETVYHCIESCREWGIPVILNPAPADARLDLARIGGIFLFAPNETELASITGMPVTSLDQARAAASFLLGEGLDRILVTLGEKGCLLVTRDETLHVPGIPVSSIDSTGAGDAFIGSLAVRYLETKDLEESMRWANAYAALSTTGKGTQKSFVKRSAFDAFLRETAR